MNYTEEEITEMFDEMLDECYEHTIIGGIAFSASQILKKCDPIAYQVYMSDFEAELEEDEDE